jgi:hypothetical protein
MSELRDLTAALRSIANRQTGIEECLLVLVRNSEQQADWRHEQRGIEQRRTLEDAEQAAAIKQVQVWLSERVGRLERARDDEEVTQA